MTYPSKTPLFPVCFPGRESGGMADALDLGSAACPLPIDSNHVEPNEIKGFFVNDLGDPSRSEAFLLVVQPPNSHRDGPTAQERIGDGKRN